MINGLHTTAKNLLPTKLFHHTLCFLMSLLLSANVFAVPLSIENLGTLTDLSTVRNEGEHYYQFTLPKGTTVSIFLNGLSAGYTAELMDAQHRVLQKTKNDGIEKNNPKSTIGMPILATLQPDVYQVHVFPNKQKPNASLVYTARAPGYILNLIPDSAPNMIIVAAHDSPDVGHPTIVTKGAHDEVELNQAIGELAKQGGGKLLLRPGIYFIGDNVLTTTPNLTLTGTGWRTVLRLTKDARLKRAGLLRSRFMLNKPNQETPLFQNQHILHLTLDGNNADQADFSNSVGTFGTYENSSIEDIRSTRFLRYGFDPHGSAFNHIHNVHLIMTDCLAENNGQDGIVCDACNESTISHNVMNANGRHGLNLVTASLNNIIDNNSITENAENGITVQSGPRFYNRSDHNNIMHNTILSNKKHGIYLYRSQYNEINDNNIKLNGTHGIQIRAASVNYIYNNNVEDNSQSKPNAYCGIYLSNEKSVYATFNTVSNNTVTASAPQNYKFGIAEHDVNADHNIVASNTLKGIAKPIRLKGLNSEAHDNHIE